MKKKYQVLQYILLIPLMLLNACNSYEDVTAEDEFKEELLIGTWALDYADFSGVNVTSEFNDFANNEITQLTFIDDGTWNAEYGRYVFGDNGSWELVLGEDDQLIMSDFQITYEFSFDGANLYLDFFLDGEQINGRVNGLTGRYRIQFSKVVL
jgi:hypothetical protein